MRLFTFAALLGLAACESNENVVPTNVVWMDWPAEVQVNEPFRTRLVVSQPCAIIRGFVPSATAQTTTVTFAPYFLVDKDPIYCASYGEVTSEFDFTVNIPLDTAGTAPGLLERVYEMRAGAPSCAVCLSLNAFPWQTFGYVTARAEPPPPTVVRNAAGTVFAERDSVGCTRIRPAGLLAPNAAIVVENPPDTIPPYAFVRGYIYQPAAPVCGEPTVFHVTGQYTGG